MEVICLETGGRPVLAHGQGNHELKPVFDRIRDYFFSQPAETFPPPRNLTLLTCNNGHESLGLFESSARRIGIPVTVGGADRSDWVNARDKPTAILEALDEIETDFVLYADSRDCVLFDDPSRAVEVFRSEFRDARLVFGADLINWPPLRKFEVYEKERAKDSGSRYRFLNGGCWIGEVGFCRLFFERLSHLEPVPEVADSEQGLIKSLLPTFPEEVAIDYGLNLFFNCGYVGGDVVAFPGTPRND